VYSNGVQFVITIIALLKHQSKIVQTSLIGAVISNMVLLVGIGFFLGGLQHTEQHFDRTSTSKSLDELVLSIAALIIPTAINVFSRLDADHVAQFSRAESKLLLFSYLCYLVFAYKSHSTMYTTSHTRVPERKFLATAINVETRLPRGAANLVASVGGAIVEVSSIREPEEETISPHISVSTLALTLIVDTTFLGFGVAFAVESIDGLTQQTSLTRNFVGLILLPLLGCNIHAIKLAMKDEMPHSFSITIGSSIQFLLCILPLAVIIGWVRDDPTMTLLFDEFQVVSLVIGLMVLRYITDDGKSNWYVLCDWTYDDWVIFDC